MRIIIVSILLFIHAHTFSQGNKCNSNILGQVHATIEKLGSNEIRVFLSTFDESCKDNVEFSEFSNELLFDVFEKHTKKILVILEKQHPEIKLEAILNELKNPLTNKVDLNFLIQRVERIKVSEKLKRQILDALQVSNN